MCGVFSVPVTLDVLLFVSCFPAAHPEKLVLFQSEHREDLDAASLSFRLVLTESFWPLWDVGSCSVSLSLGLFSWVCPTLPLAWEKNLCPCVLGRCCVRLLLMICVCKANVDLKRKSWQHSWTSIWTDLSEVWIIQGMSARCLQMPSPVLHRGAGEKCVALKVCIPVHLS